MDWAQGRTEVLRYAYALDGDAQRNARLGARGVRAEHADDRRKRFVVFAKNVKARGGSVCSKP